MTDEKQNGPLEIKKIVITYHLQALPPALIRSFTLLRGKMRRKRLRIEVVLLPLQKIPEDADVLFVPEELLEEARQAAPLAKRIALLDTTQTYQASFDKLISDLEDGTEIFARSIDEAGSLEKRGAQGGVIVRYRGSERIG
jgi:mannitol-specific phosphotransferase system IIBC component